MYLTGATNHRDEPTLLEHGVGLMLGPNNSYHRQVDRFPFFAADNGCFTDKWVEDKHLAWLDALPRERCLFAVSPDVYPDALASLERGVQYAPLLREMGFPVAVVAQDGAEQLTWPWDDIDCLFLGGKKQRHEWKTSPVAESLAREARARGKWVHMGRVNSLKRLERARQMGCNSADGTFVKYRRRLRAGETGEERDARGALELGRWLVWLDRNRSLFTHEAPSLPVHKEASR